MYHEEAFLRYYIHYTRYLTNSWYVSWIGGFESLNREIQWIFSIQEFNDVQKLEHARQTHLKNGSINNVFSIEYVF